MIFAMTISKLIVLLISFLLALVVAGIFPPVAGGAGQMIVVIFLTIGFKVIIEYLLAKREKKSG